MLKTRDQPIQWANTGAVEALEASEAFQAGIPPDAPWRLGAVVAPASGPFAHPGVVLEIRGNRAVLAMLLFGELRQAPVDVNSLVARE